MTFTWTKRHFRQTAVLGVLGLISMISFQNCGADFVVRDDLSFASLGMPCEAQLQAQFESTYAPFLRSNCTSCHVTGPGKGSFASANVGSAFGAFLLATSDRIDNLAVSSSHASPFTGSQNQEAINVASASWNQAVDTCKAGTGQTDTSGAATTAKTMAATETNKDLSWNLDSELQSGSANFGGAVLTITVRAVTANNYTTYFFNAPKIKTGSKALRIKKLMLKINNQMQTLGTTYSQIDTALPAGQTVTLSTSQLLLEYPANVSDTVSVTFGQLEAQ